MKKTISIIVAILMLLSLVACNSLPQGDGTHTHADETNDGVCDICGYRIGYGTCTDHRDNDGDDRCDRCSKLLREECSVHTDADADNLCDVCGAYVESLCSSHVDEDGNNRCDVCMAFISVTVCDGHTDGNDDGRCDSCYASVVIVLDFYAINDMHGKFSDTDQSVGVDELTTYLKDAKETDDNVIILSSGDMWQGSSESNLTRGNIVTDWMNELDFVSMTLGNHEYDWGAEYIVKNAEIAQFPFLAINVYDRATNKPVDYCEPSVMIERDGVKIGIIGAIGDCYSSISKEQVEDVYFKVGKELTELVRVEAERLRAAGAELIVYSLHDGNGSSTSGATNISSAGMSSYYDTALSEGYVDLVFEGHSHQRYVHIDSKGVYHLQGSGDGKGISHVELELNIITDSVNVSEAEYVDSYEYASLADDPIVEALLEKYASVLAEGSRQLGYNSALRGSDYISNLVAELYYEAGMEKWGDEYDIALGGGYLNVRAPYQISAGNVVYGDLVSILPFENDIVLCSVSGRNLKYQFFENSKYYISYGEYGKSIRENLDMYATYYVVVDRYTLNFAPNGLTEVDILAEKTYARDLVAEYIERGGLTDYTLTDIGYILELVGGMEYNVKTDDFYVKGEIVSAPTYPYGNATIRDENGDEIYVYGIWSGSGDRYDAMANPPKLGDTVIIYGPAMYYYNPTTGEKKIEITKGTLVRIVEE